MDIRPDEISRTPASVAGGPHAADDLLPLVYEELRRIARAKLATPTPGQTLQATALVHEAYLRLEGKGPAWSGRRHFLFAAARAMQDILVERARQRASLKRGGDRARINFDDLTIAEEAAPDAVLAVAEALSELERLDPRKHQLVMLRFFAGCTADEAAVAMELSPSTVAREWRFARAWLHQALSMPAESA